jgi:hypothetical protein
MWGLPPPESLFNANMATPLTKKDEEKVEDLSRRGKGGSYRYGCIFDVHKNYNFYNYSIG